MGKKRLPAILLAGLIAVGLAACGEDNTYSEDNICGEEECEQEIYKDGYCENHFYLHQAEELTEGLGF